MNSCSNDSLREKVLYQSERCKLDVYYPTKKSNFATIIFFHGGGLTGGDKFIPEGFKNQGLCVVAPNYRLSPKASCPDYLEDAAAVYNWVMKNIEKYGGDKSKVFVAGHSAGGYLAMMLALDKRWLTPYSLNCDSIYGVISFSSQVITHFTIRQERGVPSNRVIVDDYAPLYYIREKTAPIFLTTGDRNNELMNRHEENMYFYKMMLSAGNKNIDFREFEGFDHGAMLNAAIPDALEFIKKRMLH